tara:strand:+ start:862 stop:1749 length:888 start_codon:yes stop_codon:yes gene_type:complete
MKKVAVIFGGSSSEKEVSLHTGLSVVEAIKDIYDVKSINIGDNFNQLHSNLFNIDVVFNALHGGYGENGDLQKYFEKYSIKYTGSGPKASKIAMDKNKTKLIAKSNNIPILNWKIINKGDKLELNNLSFPLIIKPNDGGSTIGLYFVNNKDEFNDSILSAFNQSNTLMIEKYFKGREISVPIIDGQVLPIIEIKSSNFIYDYESKYQSNKTKYEIPAKIDNKLERLISDDALLLYNKIGCKHYARIDFLLNNDQYYLLEINTLPGLTSTSLLPKAAKHIGLSYQKLITKIIELAS